MGKRDFQMRTLTALIFVPTMLLGMFGGRVSFVSLFGIIGILCLYEFSILFSESATRKHIYPFRIVNITLFIVLYLFSVWIGLGLVTIKTLAIAPLLIAIVYLYSVLENGENTIQNLGRSFLGTIYIGLPLSLVALFVLTSEPYSPYPVIGIVVLNWLNDTSAYLFGRKIGKTKLAPKISPNKSWEGAIAGAIVGILGSLVLAYCWSNTPVWVWLSLSMIVTVFGLIGDLLESKMKRSVEKKDSGGMLPGHGGFLDRFDALLLIFLVAIPFLFLALR